LVGMRKMKGKYYVRVRIGGKEKLLPTGTGNQRDAEKVLRKIQQQELEVKQRLRAEIDELTRKLTISDGIKYFEKNIGRERNLQKSTLYTYGLAMKDFAKCFKNISTYEDLDKKHFSTLVNYLQLNYNNTTVNIRLRSIRAMLNYILEKDMIEKLPFRVKQIKVDQPLPKFITPDEMNQIYVIIEDDQLAAIFRVYEMTGMRLSELKHSKREGEFIIIKKSKNRRQRIIPIPIDSIMDYDIAKKSDLSPSRISHIFSDTCNKAGLKGKTLHCLRHTFALRKLMETNNISLVKELLGHSSVQVTEIYTQFPKSYLMQIFKQRQINKETGNNQRLEA